MSRDQLKIIESLRNGPMIIERLRWIDEQLLWMGEFNRSELVFRFGISTQQASSDINRYQELAPENFVMDYRYKAFCATDAYRPVFESDPVAWLQNNANELNQRISFEDVKGVPQRVEPSIFRALNRCHKRNIPAVIKMMSLKKDEIVSHIISPHSVVATTLRWHVRGWDHVNRRFGDFPLSRIQEVTPSEGQRWVSNETDSDWNDFIDIVITPADGLSVLQRESLSKSFGMKNGKLIIPVRKCLAYYRLASMQLLSAIREHKGAVIDPKLFIKVENWEQLKPLVQLPPDTSMLIPLELESDFDFDRLDDKLSSVDSGIGHHVMVETDASVVGGCSVRLGNPQQLSTDGNQGLRMLWLAAGLSKIAASYADALCQQHDVISEYSSYLSLIGMHNLSRKVPVIISVAGKHEDAINTAKIVSTKCVKGGLVSCSSDSMLVDVMKRSDIELYTTYIPFPERDERFVNIRSIIAMCRGVESYIRKHLNLEISFRDITDSTREQAQLATTFISGVTSFSRKSLIILTNGDHGMLQESWRSLLCESGVHSPLFFDIKDYTHGDHRHASLQQNCFFIVLATPDIQSFVDIFYGRFSQIFEVHVIKLPQIISARFWSNLYIALHVTHAMSCYIGYHGTRPAKNALIHSWRGWGDITDDVNQT